MHGENAKYQEKRENDERMKDVVGGEREKKTDRRESRGNSLVLLCMGMV